MEKRQPFSLNKKFSRDLLWNFIALGFLAISGILINLIIVNRFGTAVLGVFNQVYAVYIIASQFSAGGIQYSVLKQVAEAVHVPRNRSCASWSAILAVLVIGMPIAFLNLIFAGAIGEVMDSPEVGEGMALAAPGLAFFALNKVLMGILNGLRRMQAFATCQILRCLFMITFVVVVSQETLPSYWLGATFTVAELLLATILLGYVSICSPPVREAFDIRLLKAHVWFGFKGFMSGAMLEINSRVDVLMLGLVLSDRLVGIYVFAATLAEGFYNLIVVVRNNVNPILVQLLNEGRFDDILVMVHQIQRYVYVAVVVLALLLIGVYKPTAHFFLGHGDFLQSWFVLIILVCGIIFCSGYIPFNFMLLQAGHPGYHTLLACINLASNLLLNAILIPHFGLYGAAMGTSIASVLSVFYLNWILHRRLSFSLGLPFSGS